MPRHDLVMPELHLRQAARVSQWLVKRGATVRLGDALLEVVAGAVTVDLPAPAGGVLVARLVGIDDPLTAGQRLAIIDGDAAGTADGGPR